MGLALWVIGAGLVLVVFGTYAIQALILVVAVAWRLTVWLAAALVGLMSIMMLAIFDRAELKRIAMNPGAHAKVRTTVRSGG